MYALFRSFLFLFSAEKAHAIAMNALQMIASIPIVSNIIQSIYRVSKPIPFIGLQFPNRIGLAAGFDKNAKYLKALKMLGFGSVEIGTVTPRPQPGNDLPRLFRLKKDEALINRMGFNNEGVDAVRKRLLHRPEGLIVGGNIGKNKITENEHAVHDYVICLNKLYDVVDYFVVNVSSPNTPNLRALQEKEPLGLILKSLTAERALQQEKGLPYRPILLKIAPDVSFEQMDGIVEMVIESGCDGMVISNTTIQRNGLKTSSEDIESIGSGGLSGPILLERSNEVVAYIHALKPELPIIGVGGIDSKIAAQKKIQAGAQLVQIYTSFIYKGPRLIHEIASI